MIKEFIPPVLLNFMTGLRFGWQGNYQTWAEAKGKCSGYDSALIFNKVRDAVMSVKNGKAVFERDSVLFDKVQYSFPLLSSLALIALSEKGKLNVLDFGGSLGSSYFQNRSLFSELQEFNWCVVEQEHFVDEGQRNFSDDHLHFYFDMKSCLAERSINTILFGSVLQYIEDPYALLDEAMATKTAYIMIDRTPVMLNGNDRITIQKVPKKIYDASYPSRIMSERKLLDLLQTKYELIYDSISPERINVRNAALKGYFLRRKPKSAVSS